MIVVPYPSTIRHYSKFHTWVATPVQGCVAICTPLALPPVPRHRSNIYIIYFSNSQGEQRCCRKRTGVVGECKQSIIGKHPILPRIFIALPEHDWAWLVDCIGPQLASFKHWQHLPVFASMQYFTDRFGSAKLILVTVSPEKICHIWLGLLLHADLRNKT